MLVRYRKDYEKIAMGLLSLLPELHNYDRFTEELHNAVTRHFPIYLWKDEEDNHFIAVVILEEGRAMSYSGRSLSPRVNGQAETSTRCWMPLRSSTRKKD